MIENYTPKQLKKELSVNEHCIKHCKPSPSQLKALTAHKEALLGQLEKRKPN